MATAARVIRMDEHRPSSPQLEDGHIRIANELFDAILKFPFTLKQQSVLLAIVRKTYGFNKKADDMSAAQIGALCGMARNHVTETLNELCAMGVITKRAGEYGCVIGINKRHDEWRAERKTPRAKIVPNQDSPESGLEVVPNQDKTSPESGQVDSPESGHTKDNLPKDNQKTTSKSVQPVGRTRASGSASFDTFWSAYPRKDKKADALKAFAKLDPDADLLADMVARVELLKQTDEWLKDAGQFIPLAASWLNGRRWEDEAPQVGYTADELRVIDAYNRAIGGTDWPEAKVVPYSRERAGLIRTFLGFSMKGVEGVEPYFRHVADAVPPADTTGFDWLLRRETYLKIREGVHRQRSEA